MSKKLNELKFRGKDGNIYWFSDFYNTNFKDISNNYFYFAVNDMTLIEDESDQNNSANNLIEHRLLTIIEEMVRGNK